MYEHIYATHEANGINHAMKSTVYLFQQIWLPHSKYSSRSNFACVCQNNHVLLLLHNLLPETNMPIKMSI